MRKYGACAVDHDIELSVAELGHGALDVAGQVPGFGELFDGANCAWYGAEGDNLNAAASCAAMIPTLGNLTTLGKHLGKAAGKIENATNAGVKASPNGGFKVGVGAEEIGEINARFGGSTLMHGSPANTIVNASRYGSFWEKSAVVIRDIAGGHMYDNGNKRTAQAVIEQLMERNGVVSGPTSADLRRVIDQVGKGQLYGVADIASALRGY
ncbi:hypothetical protein [Saccharomonospora marina]|nr:hypothetical protein [Saccharomonospora marina]